MDNNNITPSENQNTNQQISNPVTINSGDFTQPPTAQKSKLKWVIIGILGVAIIGTIVYLFAGSDLFKGQIKLKDKDELVMKEFENCLEATHEELTTNAQIYFTVKENCVVDFSINEEYGKLFHLSLDYSQEEDTYDIEFKVISNFEHATSVNWKFGDNSPEIANYHDKPIVHEYKAAGDYEVTLSAYAEINGKVVKLMTSKKITVKEQSDKPLVADIEVKKINDYEYKVSDKSKPTNKLHKATLTCGTTDLGKMNFNVNYNTSSDPYDNPFRAIRDEDGVSLCNYGSLKGGKYTITYTLYDENDKIISEEKYDLETPTNLNYVLKEPLPVADFECIQMENTYTLECSTEQNGNATWNFPDINGKTTTQKNNVVFQYTYQKAGTHNVTLTLKNSEGSDTKTKEITLKALEGIPVADIELITKSENEVRVFDKSENYDKIPKGILQCKKDISTSVFSPDHLGQTIQNLREEGTLCTYDKPGTYIIKYSIEAKEWPPISQIEKTITIPMEVPVVPETPESSETPEETDIPDSNETSETTEAPETPEETDIPDSNEVNDDDEEISSTSNNNFFASILYSSLESLENLINPVTVKPGDVLLLVTTSKGGENVLNIRFNGKQLSLDIKDLNYISNDDSGKTDTKISDSEELEEKEAEVITETEETETEEIEEVETEEIEEVETEEEEIEEEEIEETEAEKTAEEIEENNENTEDTEDTAGPLSRYTEEEIPEIKTGEITVDEIIGSGKFECLKAYDSPATFDDTEDDAVKLLSALSAENRPIIQGFSSGKEALFKPNNLATRAEIIKTLMISSCTPFNLDVSDVKLPKDVRENDWFMDYVASAKKLNIVEGYKDNTFKPANNVTRMEAIKMMASISKIPKADNSCEEKPFVDVSENHWGYELARDAFCSGISAGKKLNGKQYLFPDEEMTRAEMAVLIYNYYVTVLRNLQ